MDYLFAQRDNVGQLLRNKFILLLLDYDGTLAPIVENPRKAIVPKETRELLQGLSENTNCKIGIISGRSLEDIKNLVGIKNIIYVGNHGLEIEGPKIRFESQISPRLKSVMRNIAEDMQNNLSGIKGVLIENKGMTLSVHYRLVNKENMSLFEKILFEVTRPYVVHNRIKIDSGKKVYEIKPPLKWDKGKVALWLLARQQFISGEKRVLPIYIGDDMTDEDVFKALKKKGLTVFVGESGKSNANYYLRNTEEVIRFLRLISGLKYN